MVAAVEGGERRPSPAASRLSVRDGGEAGEDRQAERAAHHERGVDDARGQAGFARLDVAHGGQQHRVEGDAGAEAEQDHAREHVGDEAPVDRRPREEQRARPRPAAGPPPAARLMPKRMTSLAERPSENAPMIRLAGRKASPTCSGL